MTKKCSIEGCTKPQEKRGWCQMHYRRWQRHGHMIVTRRPAGSGTVMASGHISINVGGRPTYEHILIAERALGRRLPDGAQVHHVNLNPADNAPTNLVICPSDAYHKLLHKRMRALAACGNANWRSCHFCHAYDDPESLIFRKSGGIFHRECEQQYERSRWPKRKAQREAI